MKKPFKLIGVLSGTLLITLFAAIVLLSAGARRGQHRAHALKTSDSSGILLDSFKKREVSLDQITPYIDYFNKNCVFNIIDAAKKDTTKVSFRGSRLRNADVLASLGLINANNIFAYTECENIRLRTRFGYDPNKKIIKVYVHPVVVNAQNKVTAALYFDINGNLYTYNAQTQTGTLYSTDCLYPRGLSKKTTRPDLVQTLPATQLYAVDLNNPCPPCDL